eukprot:TRINITY_DN57437_c0_g1_i1.p1 TRINITY_DN57437_c0_g1~~TRINITY_DN57437_c0_g1_i1.p1  ORF type:complete len:393 (+),score=12.39 TRINITY_DN57437_c0_g1_i1:118-1179(+)
MVSFPMCCALLLISLQTLVVAIRLGDDDKVTTTEAPAVTTAAEAGSAVTTTSEAAGVTTAAAPAVTTAQPSLAIDASAPKADCAAHSKNTEYSCSQKNRAYCHENDTGPDMNCTRNDERCVWARNVDGPYIPCCEKTHMFEMLVWFRNLIQKHGHENPNFWWIPVYGTLLAMYRDCDLIDWDTDVDIAVPYDQVDWLDALLKAHTSEASPPYSFWGRGEKMARLYLSEIDTAHIDIWYALNGTDAGPNGTFAVMMTEGYEGHNDGLDSSNVFPISDMDSKECCLQHECFPCPAKVTPLLDKWWPTGWGVPGYTKADPALVESLGKAKGVANAIADTVPTFMLREILTGNTSFS